MKDTHVSPVRRRGRRPAPTLPPRQGGAWRRASRWTALVSLTVLAIAAALTGTVSSASADPTGCTITNGGTFAESRCTGGTGEHRVVMRQRHFNPAIGVIDCPGPWVPVGAVSRASCASQQVISVTVETRPGTGTPGMGSQPPTGPIPTPTPQPGLDCQMATNGAQLVVDPGGFKALNTPAGGSVQTYRASATVAIDFFGVRAIPTVLDRI